MLQSRIRKALEARRDPDAREAGFTLIELLVVVIIIGILSSIAIPVYLGQRQRAYDASVQSDLKNLSTAAETTFATSLSYPSAVTTFATNGIAPIITKTTTYIAFTDLSGSDAGYIIYGKSSGSDKVWMLSSYNGGAPVAIPAASWPTSLTSVPASLTGGSLVTATFVSPGVTFTNP
jgi:type IV pilus assembly protein PilA